MSSALTEAVRSFPIPPPNKGHICQFHNSLSWLSLLDLGVAKIRLFHILPKLFFIGAALRCYNCRPWRDLHPRRLIAPREQKQPEIESVFCRSVAKSHLLPTGGVPLLSAVSLAVIVAMSFTMSLLQCVRWHSAQLQAIVRVVCVSLCMSLRVLLRVLDALLLVLKSALHYSQSQAYMADFRLLVRVLVCCTTCCTV